jgi:hypothetical protein
LDVLEQNQQENNEYVCEDHESDEEHPKQHEDFLVVPEDKNVQETELYVDHNLLTLHCMDFKFEEEVQQISQ